MQHAMINLSYTFLALKKFLLATEAPQEANKRKISFRVVMFIIISFASASSVLETGNSLGSTSPRDKDMNEYHQNIHQMMKFSNVTNIVQ